MNRFLKKLLELANFKILILFKRSNLIPLSFLKVTENPVAKTSTEKKIHAYDYRAWDRFDVDAACAAVDEQKGKEAEEEEETDEEWEVERRDLLSKQEKEKGVFFVLRFQIETEPDFLRVYSVKGSQVGAFFKISLFIF